MQIIFYHLQRVGDHQAYNYIIATAVLSLLGTGALNLIEDRRLRKASRQVNEKLIEKFVISKKHRSFSWRDWGSISVGDILKINRNQEIPCDALILNISRSKNTA